MLKREKELLEALENVMGMYELSAVSSVMSKMGESSHYNATISRARKAIKKAREPLDLNSACSRCLDVGIIRTNCKLTGGIFFESCPECNKTTRHEWLID